MSDLRMPRLLIDRPVQTALLLRTGGHWLFHLVMIAVILALWESLAGPPRSWGQLVADLVERYQPVVVVSIVLLPLVMIDVLRLSHRFAGPVLRIRQGLRDLAEGKRPAPIVLREHDFWPEMAAEFNAAAEQLEHTHEALVTSRMTNSLS
jgi:hypothetical protein